MEGQAWLPRDAPDRTRLLETTHGRVFTVDVGPAESTAEDLPPLVLLHGLFLSSYAYERVIPKWAVRRRVVAVDLPGAGDSDHPEDPACYSPSGLATAVLEVMRALNLPPCELLGHGYGGAVALTLASEAPRAVERLILLAPLLLTASLPLEGPLSVVSSLGIEVFKRALRRADLRNYMLQGVSPPAAVEEDELDVYWDRLGRRGAREATYAMLGHLGGLVRLRDRFGSVEAPILLVWGDHDGIVPIAHGRRLLELMPAGTRLEVLDGCGHNPAREQPDALVERIDGWRTGRLDREEAD